MTIDSALLSIKRILDLCERFDLPDEHTEFHIRLMTYLDFILESDDIDLGSDEIACALLETHTMIAIDEDLDDEGVERLKMLWIPILGF
jgi:hypothetical protein